MKVGIPKESSSGETRVAVIPAGAATLTKAGLQVVVNWVYAPASRASEPA